MKIIPFLFLPVLLATTALAQGADSSRHAIGLFSETNSMFASNDIAGMSTVGLQYNKWNKKHVGYKIIIGYGSYSLTPGAQINTIVQDTAIGKTANRKIDMALIGGGIETERQFYKKLYFFAGFEIQAGYGSGTIDTTITHEYNAPQFDPITGNMVQGFAVSSYDKSGTSASMFYLGLTPYFGLKLEFRRFCIGTEFKNYLNFTSMHHSSSTETNIDFDLGNVSQSFFIQYKF